MLSKIKIVDVGITNESNDTILEYLLHRLKKDSKFYIVTPNPELLGMAHKNKHYKSILNNAEISLADGSGLFMASIFLGKPLKQRIPGVDFLEFICKSVEDKPISIGFLGGGAGVAEKTAERLLNKYPRLDVVFVGSDWNDEGYRVAAKLGKSSKQDPNVKIDLLFVAFGSPKQEEWIYKNLDHLPVKAAMGVGGAFDFIAGEVTRAPFILRYLWFEWLYRLIREPWRWHRQLALFTFIRLVLRERFGKKS